MGTALTQPMNKTVARTIAAVLGIGVLSGLAYFLFGIWQAAWFGSLCIAFITGIAFCDHCAFRKPSRM